MKEWLGRSVVLTVLLCAALVAGHVYAQQSRQQNEQQEQGDDDNGPLTIAVFGDWPYRNAGPVVHYNFRRVFPRSPRRADRPLCDTPAIKSSTLARKSLRVADVFAL